MKRRARPRLHGGPDELIPMTRATRTLAAVILLSAAVLFAAGVDVPARDCGVPGMSAGGGGGDGGGPSGGPPAQPPAGTRGFGVDVMCNDTRKNTGANDRANYDVAVKNTGDREETLYFDVQLVRLEGPPGTEPDVEKWSFWMNADECTLAPGAWFTVRLTVEAGCGCQDGVSAIVEVTASVSMDPGVLDSVMTNTTKTGEGGPESDLDIRVVVPDDPQAEERVLVYSLNVSGSWAEPDTLRVFVSSKPAGWEVSLSTDSLPVGPDMGKYPGPVELSVTVPGDALGDYYSIVLGARLEGDDRVVDADTLTVAVFSDLGVVEMSVAGEPSVGVKTSVNITISNDGLGAAGRFTAVLTAGGRTVDGREVDGLGSLKTLSYSVPWTPGAGEGTLSLSLDGQGLVLETDDGNNVGQLTVDLGEGPGTTPPPEDGDGGKDGTGEDGHSKTIMLALGAVAIVAVAVLSTIASAKASGATGPRRPKSDGERGDGGEGREGPGGERKGGGPGAGGEGRTGRRGAGSSEKRSGKRRSADRTRGPRGRRRRKGK